MNSESADDGEAGTEEQNLGETAKANQDDINLLKFTILNLTTDTTMLVIPYVFTIVTTLIMYIFIFFFWRVTHSYDYAAPDRLDDQGYSQLHRHVLLLKGIPKNIAPHEANWMIKQTLNLVEIHIKDDDSSKDSHDFFETPGEDDQEPKKEEVIFNVMTVGDYSDQFPLTKEIDSINRQIELSEKHEKMLEQLDFYNEQTKAEQKTFMKFLRKEPTTLKPFYRTFPHYYDPHMQ